MAKIKRKNFDPQTHAINKEYLYIRILPLALQTMSHGFRYQGNEEQYYAEYNRLEKIKSSLKDILLSGIPSHMPSYQRHLATKAILEKTILDICCNNRKEIKNDLLNLVLNENMAAVEKYQIPLQREEKMLIRSDFDGNIYPQENESLSPFYKKLQKRKNTPKKYYPQSYNLEEIPVWESFAQFRNFRKLEEPLKEALAQMRVPPKSIKKLNAFDLADIIRSKVNYRENPHFESSRARFIKFFIANHEDEYRQYMLSNQPLISEAFRQKNILLPYNSPETYVKYIEKTVKDMKTKGNVPQIFTIHHKIDVQDGRQKKNLAEVNNKPNLCIILDTYHTIIHTLSKNYGNSEHNFYNLAKRIEIPADTVFFGGLSKEMQITHNFAEQNTNRLSKQADGGRNG